VQINILAQTVKSLAAVLSGVFKGPQTNPLRMNFSGRRQDKTGNAISKYTSKMISDM